MKCQLRGEYRGDAVFINFNSSALPVFSEAKICWKLYKASLIHTKDTRRLLKSSAPSPKKDSSTSGHKASLRGLGFSLVHYYLVLFNVAICKIETAFSFIILIFLKIVQICLSMHMLTAYLLILINILFLLQFRFSFLRLWIKNLMVFSYANFTFTLSMRERPWMLSIWTLSSLMTLSPIVIPWRHPWFGEVHCSLSRAWAAFSPGWTTQAPSAAPHWNCSLEVCCPSLDMIKHLSVFLIVRVLKENTDTWLRPINPVCP